MTVPLRPTFTVIAGSNGAGKSTLTAAVRVPAGVPILDPDAIGVMLRELAAMCGSPRHIIYIGDQEEDRQAARDAKVSFHWARDFFADPGPLYPDGACHAG